MSSTALVTAFERAGVSQEQLAEVLRNAYPEFKRLDSFEQRLAAFAHRAAGNGFTADLANMVAAELADFGVPEQYSELVTEIVDHFRSGGDVTANEAARFARRAYTALEENAPAPSQPNPPKPVNHEPGNVIDVTPNQPPAPPQQAPRTDVQGIDVDTTPEGAITQ